MERERQNRPLLPRVNEKLTTMAQMKLCLGRNPGSKPYRLKKSSKSLLFFVGLNVSTLKFMVPEAFIHVMYQDVIRFILNKDTNCLLLLLIAVSAIFPVLYLYGT